MSVHLAVDTGGNLCTNSRCTLIPSWPGASKRSRDGALDGALYKNLPF